MYLGNTVIKSNNRWIWILMAPQVTDSYAPFKLLPLATCMLGENPLFLGKS